MPLMLGCIYFIVRKVLIFIQRWLMYFVSFFASQVMLQISTPHILFFSICSLMYIHNLILFIFKMHISCFQDVLMYVLIQFVFKMHLFCFECVLTLAYSHTVSFTHCCFCSFLRSPAQSRWCMCHTHRT